MPASPTPKGRGGDGRGWCWGAGPAHRAPLGRGAQQEGRTGKPVALAAQQRRSLQTGARSSGVPAFTHVLFVYGNDC